MDRIRIQVLNPVGVFTGFTLIGLTLASPVRAAETAIIQEILDGNQLYIDSQQAKVSQKATEPQQVSTRNSRGQLLFNSGAVGRLNRFSRMQLGSSCYQLRQGQILVSGKQDGCTRSARLSVRGTNYVLEVSEDGATEVYVLEGEVELRSVEPNTELDKTPSTDKDQHRQPLSEQEVIIRSGESLRVSPEGTFSSLRKLTAGDYRSIFKGPLFRGFRTEIPAALSLKSYLRSQYPSVRIPSLPRIKPGSPLRLPGGRFFRF
ncbi:MAG TPA: FecR domain-containing protein [Prochlorococcus sp.]